MTYFQLSFLNEKATVSYFFQKLNLYYIFYLFQKLNIKDSSVRSNSIKDIKKYM